MGVPTPLPPDMQDKRIPILIHHGKKNRTTARVAIMWPSILYTEVVYLQYYGRLEMFTTKQVWDAWITKEPLQWPHAVPMDKYIKRAKRRERDRIRQTKQRPHR